MIEGGWLPAKVQRSADTGRCTLAVDFGEQPVPTVDYVLVKVRQARNVKHHRKYWGLLKAVVDATGRWHSVEDMHRWLKWELRMYRAVAVRDGYTVLEWDSIDFAAMAQREFAEFYDRALAIIAFETGIDAEALKKE